MYDLFLAYTRDMPEIDLVTGVSFDHFVAQEVEDPAALSDAYLLPVNRGRYVGLSNVLAMVEEPGVLHRGLTAVLPE